MAEECLVMYCGGERYKCGHTSSPLYDACQGLLLTSRRKVLTGPHQNSSVCVHMCGMSVVLSMHYYCSDTLNDGNLISSKKANELFIRVGGLLLNNPCVGFAFQKGTGCC